MSPLAGGGGGEGVVVVVVFVIVTLSLLLSPLVRFRRIFPPDDKFKLEKYINLLVDSLQVGGNRGYVVVVVVVVLVDGRLEVMVLLLLSCLLSSIYSRWAGEGGWC